MTTIRPLVVDDSVVVRNTLREVFRSVPEIGPCAVAADGKIALELIPQVRPGIVILDLEMPRLNGLETLRALQQTHPQLPVIVFSSLTEAGARETIQALAMGAADYVTKPARQNSLPATMERIRGELVPKVLAICAKRPTGRPSVTRRARHNPPSDSASVPQLLAIGSSTGGPAALERILSTLPADFQIPIVVAQHMPAVFTARLADRLNSRSPLTVTEVTEPKELQPGCAYIASGAGHMIITCRDDRNWCEPVSAPPGDTLKPAADLLFQTAAEVCESETLAVVLSGMGRDGERGCEAVRDADGYIIVQDEASSVVWGMPGSVARAGLADEIVSLSEISSTISRLVSPPCTATTS